MSESTAVEKRKAEVFQFMPTGGTEAVVLTVNRVRSLLCKPTRNGKVCSDKDAIRFIMLCKAKGLNPWEGDAFLVGYDNNRGGEAEFSLITSHQAFLKRSEANPEYDGMESGVTVEDGDGNIKDIEGDFVPKGHTLLAGWARVFFKGRSHPMYRRIKLQRFQKDNQFWNNDPAGMICKCAEADALRSSFPTLLGGLYQRQEVEAGPYIDIDSEQVDAAAIAQHTPEPNDDEVPMDYPPKKTTPPPKAKPTGKSPQAELEAIIDAEGFTFDQFREAVTSIGLVDDASSLADWSEVPTEVAGRCIKAKVGLIKSMRETFGKEVA